MKKALFILILLLFFNQASAGNFIYPFAEVANPKCRFSSWNTLWSECKIPLPRIEGANYTKYKDNTSMRRIYSILWWATYNYWWDVWFWSHLWIDFATSLWTPVRSIWDWEVITAGWLNWWWNVVVIKHQVAWWKFIYSNYWHLSKINAKKWLIKAWESVWEVWATWNSYWNHLHFQIDITNQSHPYWYSSCSKWIDIFDVVNNWQCRDYLLANTIDPILFLEGNWTFESIEVIKRKQNSTIKIEQRNIKTREQILDEEIEEFLKWHVFEFKTWVTWENLKANITYITKLNVYKNWRPFTWNLPWKWVEFKSDPSVKFFPESAIVIENWFRNINITWTKSWKQTIRMMLGKKTVATAEVNFFNDGDFSNPTDAVISPSWYSIALWEEKIWGVAFKTKFWSQQVHIPYDGTYKLRASYGKVKFCNVSNRESKQCWPIEMVSELEFRYADTKNWILLFNMVALDYSPIKLSLIKVGQKNELTWTKKQVLVSNPNNLDPSYPYFQENIDSIKKWYFRLNSWYLMQDREILGSQLKNIITSMLTYEYFRSWDDMIKKQKVIKKIRSWQEFAKNINDSKKITRWELSKIVFDNFWLQVIRNNEVKLNDEKWIYKDYITSLRTGYNFCWKDQFASNYFQPDKAITIWETLYFVNKISSFVQI
ncbi:MAG: Secreted peptidase [uncultured bacterium (gcode 4)]|uniref:Secreted peptidase n=1 Tax=uncultured bacterium (gcode 4) TaxID=1234023 RepID=K2GC01_9BACT|nr:MAG: Secreted peptidase [uncultured bacterium (gcode 4)]